MKIYTDPQVSEQNQKAALDEYIKLSGKETKGIIGKVAPLIDKIVGQHRQGQQQASPPQQGQQPQGPGTAALPPPPGGAQPQQGSAMASQQQPQSPATHALPPPPGSPYGATYGQAQRQQAQSDLDAGEQRKIKAARDMISVDVEKQKALIPGDVERAKAVSQAQATMESEQFKAKISDMQKFMGREFSPEELSKIALHQVGISGEEGSSTEKVDVEGPDGKPQVAFRDPKSGKIFDSSHKELDMTQFKVVEKPSAVNSAEVKDLRRLNELKRKPDLSPEERDELQALEYRKKQLDDAAKRADTKLSVTVQNAAGGAAASVGTKEWASSIADDIVNHRMSPSQMSSLVGGFGKEAQARKQMILSAIQKQDPKFNFQQAEADYAFSKSPGFQNTVRYMDSVSGSIPLVVKRAKELGNSNIRFINGLSNMGKDQLNDPKLKKFQTDALLIADEVAKILQGGGTGSGTSDAKLKQAQEIIRQTDSPKALAAALEDVQQLIGYRREAVTTGTYMEGTEPRTPGAHAMGKPGDLQKVTTKEQFDKLPKGTHYIGKDGNEYEKP